MKLGENGFKLVPLSNFFSNEFDVMQCLKINYLGQFEVLQKELEKRREECIQLHSVLADHTRRMKSLSSNYGRDVDIVNEDGELALSFEAEKKINR